MAPGGGVANYVRESRLRRCKDQITDPRFARHHLSEIAFQWGFQHVTTFNRNFRHAFGMTPGEARERALASNSEAFSGESQTAQFQHREPHRWFQDMGES